MKVYVKKRAKAKNSLEVPCEAGIVVSAYPNRESPVFVIAVWGLRNASMDFRWAVAISLWTLLVGPVFDSPGARYHTGPDPARAAVSLPIARPELESSGVTPKSQPSFNRR